MMMIQHGCAMLPFEILRAEYVHLDISKQRERYGIPLLNINIFWAKKHNSMNFIWFSQLNKSIECYIFISLVNIINVLNDKSRHEINLCFGCSL